MRMWYARYSGRARAHVCACCDVLAQAVRRSPTSPRSARGRRCVRLRARVCALSLTFCSQPYAKQYSGDATVCGIDVDVDYAPVWDWSADGSSSVPPMPISQQGSVTSECVGWA
jgi:hypothetical protein